MTALASRHRVHAQTSHLDTVKSQPKQSNDYSLLYSLFKDKPSNQYILVWRKLHNDKKLSRYFLNVNEALTYALSQKESADVYFGLGTSSIKKSEKQRFKSHEVEGLSCLWVDLDVLHPVHTKTNLPPTLNDAIALLNRMPVEPTFILDSGHGLQAFWQFETFLNLDNENRDSIAALSYAWKSKLKELASEHGWTIDATQDLARVLRVPNTLNHKDKSDIKPVKLLLNSEKTYSVETLEQCLKGDIVSQNSKRLISSYNKSNADSALIIDETREISVSKLESLFEVEPKVKSSWERKRKDFSDQSASAYDLSLATLAANNGWKDQEIVDLLISARRKHKNDLKLREDYYARTIQRARGESSLRDENADSEQTDKPKLNVKDEDYPRIAKQALNALKKANEPPYLFRFGNMLSRMEFDDNGSPMIVELNQSRMAHELTRAVNWYKVIKSNDKSERRIPSTPTTKFVQDFLATPNIDLPILTRTVTAPVFAADGTLQNKIGYNEKSRSYYHENKNFSLDEIPEQPTKQQIENARSLIIDDLLGDFPFVSDADKAHSVALMLLPFVRDLIDGSTPLHDIEATAIGSGKTILAKLLATPSTLSPVLMTEARDEEEWRKRLTSALRNSPSFVIIDNVRHRLESTALASLLTTNEWEDRLMGETKMIRLSVRAAFVVTANNPSFSDEMMRRSIRIRLDPKCDKAWLREGFKIPDIEDWARRNRAKLIWSALTLVQSWIAEGKPLHSGKKLGSYERWSEVMGGILKTIGVNGFLENLNEFYEEADEQGEAWRSLIAEWWYKFGEKDVTVSELWSFSTDVEMLDFGNGTEQARKVKFGKMLASARDRQIGDFRIKRSGVIRHARQWRLEFVGDGVPPITLSNDEELNKKRVINYSNDDEIRFDTHIN